jgi:hypothetical protein
MTYPLRRVDIEEETGYADRLLLLNVGQRLARTLPDTAVAVKAVAIATRLE